MIRLIRHDGREILLNIELIGKVESDPATIITLLNGEKIEVKNTVTDVVTKIKACRQGIEEKDQNLDKNQTNSRQNKKITSR